MYRNSQITRFPKNAPGDGPEAAGENNSPPEAQAVTPEVLDSTGRPVKERAPVSGNILGLISAVVGIVAFILIFVGMFFHFVIALNIIICLFAVGFAIAALMKQDSAGKVFAAAGMILSIFDLLVQLICMIIIMISSGISAVFSLF